MSICLTLEKRRSILDGLQLIEYVPRIRVCSLICSEETERECKRWVHYQLHRDQLTAYLAMMKADCAKVQYLRADHGWGRAFVSGSLGLSAFRKTSRNTLIFGNYYDFDLKNAHPAITLCICKEYGISCPCIESYVEKREEHLRAVAEVYNVNEKQAKKLFLCLMFFGSVSGWKKREKVRVCGDYPFVNSLRAELHQIAQRVKSANVSLYSFVEELQKKKREGVKEERGEEKKREEGNILGSFFAYYLQEHETRIVGTVMKWLMCDTNVMDFDGGKIGTYEFDGMKLWKKGVDAYPGGKMGLLTAINEKTRELTGFSLSWEEKEIQGCIDLSGVRIFS